VTKDRDFTSILSGFELNYLFDIISTEKRD